MTASGAGDRGMSSPDGVPRPTSKSARSRIRTVPTQPHIRALALSGQVTDPGCGWRGIQKLSDRRNRGADTFRNRRVCDREVKVGKSLANAGIVGVNKPWICVLITDAGIVADIPTEIPSFHPRADANLPPSHKEAVIHLVSAARSVDAPMCSSHVPNHRYVIENIAIVLGKGVQYKARVVGVAVVADKERIPDHHIVDPASTAQDHPLHQARANNAILDGDVLVRQVAKELDTIGVSAVIERLVIYRGVRPLVVKPAPSKGGIVHRPLVPGLELILSVVVEDQSFIEQGRPAAGQGLFVWHPVGRPTAVIEHLCVAKRHVVVFPVM